MKNFEVLKYNENMRIKHRTECGVLGRIKREYSRIFTDSCFWSGANTEKISLLYSSL